MKKLILLLLFIPLVSFGQENIYSVTSEVGLNVRDKPGIDGNKIATLLLDDFVIIKQKTDKSLTINDLNKANGKRKEISGHWVKIETLNPPKFKGNKVLWKSNYENIKGYTFDGFLKKINLRDTITSTEVTNNNEVYYYQKRLFTGKTITVNAEFPTNVVFKTYLNGLKYRETEYYQYSNNPCIIADNIFYKNGSMMAAGLNKDCAMWDYTYYYENGRIKSQNTEGGAYTGRREHTEWYDNGNLKYGFGKSNASIEIIRTQHTDAYKIKSFDISPDNLKKYNITRFNTKYPFVGEKRWFYRNGEKEKVIKFIDAHSLEEDYGDMGSTFFIEIDGKAINLEEPQILESECWNEKGIKVICP